MRLSDTSPFLRENLLERIAPKVDYGENIQDPFVPELQVAKWLPVAFTQTANRGRGQSAYVIAKGKPVAMCRGGDFGLVPAGVAADIVAGGLSYSADDVTWKTEDLTTGAAVAAAVAYSLGDVAQAIWDRGLVDAAMATEAAAKYGIAGYDAANLPGAGGTAPDEEYDAIIHALISSPVGHAKDNLWVYLGSAEAGDFKFQNYAPKAKASLRTAGVLRVPHIVTASATQVVDGTGATGTGGADAQPTVGAWYNATNAALFARYSERGLSAASSVALVILTANVLAKNIAGRTPISSSLTGLLLREVSSIAKISKSGDFWVDEMGGALVVFNTAWTGTPTSTTFTFSHYAANVASTAAEVSFAGEARPGDLVTFDASSNFIAAGSTVASSEIVGQVLAVLKGPRGGLERVRTGYHDSAVSARSKMPGSATDGYSDLITMAEETAADETIIIKFCVK
jgi:hypothetical protein